MSAETIITEICSSCWSEAYLFESPGFCRILEIITSHADDDSKFVRRSFVLSDSTDIVDGKMKLILGLMWTLILHYSISMPMWDSDDFGGAPPSDQTPKQRLLHWIQSRIPDKPVGNFPTDWNDGTAVGALVDAVAPGTSCCIRLSLLFYVNVW